MTEVNMPPVSPTPRSAGRTMARNVVFSVGAEFTLKIVSLLFNILIVRSLGGEQYGQMNIVLAWTMVFAFLGDLGIVQYYAREVARDRAKGANLFWDMVSLRLILAVFCSTITIGGALLLTDYSPEILLGIVIFTGTYFFQAGIASINSILIGNERVDITSVLNVAQQIITLVFQAVVLYFQLGFIWLLVAGLINMPIMLMLNFLAVRRSQITIPRIHVQPRQWWGILRSGFPFAFQQLSLSLGFKADTVLLSLTRVPNLHVGWYNIAYTNLTLMILQITARIGAAMMPTLASQHASNPEIVRAWYFRSVKYLLFMALPIAVGGMVLAAPIVKLLFPNEWPAAVPLAIVVWDIPFVVYHGFANQLATSIKREVAGARIHGGLAVVNVILNLLMIPRFGIIGSAFATVVTDVTAACLFYLLLRRSFGYGLGFTRIVRIPICAALMGLLISALSSLHLLILMPIGAIFYVTISMYAGVFTSEERLFLTSIGRRLFKRMRHMLHLDRA